MRAERAGWRAKRAERSESLRDRQCALRARRRAKRAERSESLRDRQCARSARWRACARGGATHARLGRDVPQTAGHVTGVLWTRRGTCDATARRISRFDESFHHAFSCMPFVDTASNLITPVARPARLQSCEGRDVPQTRGHLTGVLWTRRGTCDATARRIFSVGDAWHDACRTACGVPTLYILACIMTGIPHAIGRVPRDNARPSQRNPASAGGWARPPCAIAIVRGTGRRA